MVAGLVPEDWEYLSDLRVCSARNAEWGFYFNYFYYNGTGKSSLGAESALHIFPSSMLNCTPAFYVPIAWPGMSG